MILCNFAEQMQVRTRAGLLLRYALCLHPIRETFPLLYLAKTRKEQKQALMQTASNSSNRVPCNDGSFSAAMVKEGSAFADNSVDLVLDLNPIDESTRTRIQRVRIGRIQGQSPTDQGKAAEDTNRLFDELFMLAIDLDVGFDRNKWIQKGYLALCERKTVPSTEPELLVRLEPARAPLGGALASSRLLQICHKCRKTEVTELNTE